MAEPYKPSSRLRRAAAAEVTRVDRSIARVDRRERDLLEQLSALHDARATLEIERDALAHFAGTEVAKATEEPAVTPGLRAVPDADAVTLRGARIREQAIRVLVAGRHVDCPIHYRDWYQLLVAAGYVATGQDPLATFLTQIGRSPLVRSTGTKGVYVVDLEVGPRARARLGSLGAELHAFHFPEAGTVDALRAAREQRDKLVTEIHELERDIDEIARSLDVNVTADRGAEPRSARREHTRTLAADAASSPVASIA